MINFFKFVQNRFNALINVFCICVIFFINGAWFFNHWFTCYRLHIMSLSGDAVILLFTIFLGRLLTKLKCMALFNRFINIRYERSRKLALTLVALLVLLNIGVFVDTRINIISQRLVFESPFWFSRQVKKLFGFFFNYHRSLQEFYEQHLCYILP